MKAGDLYVYFPYEFLESYAKKFIVDTFRKFDVHINLSDAYEIPMKDSCGNLVYHSLFKIVFNESYTKPAMICQMLNFFIDKSINDNSGSCIFCNIKDKDSKNKFKLLVSTYEGISGKDFLKEVV